VNQSQIKKFCSALKIKGDFSQTKGWLTVYCPYAEYRHESGKDRNPSCGIKIKERGVSNFFCFSCSSAGELYDMAFELKQLSGNAPEYDFKTAFKLCNEEEESANDLVLPGEEQEEESDEHLHYFSEEVLDSYPDCWKAEDANTYCQSRLVSVWVQKELGLKFDPVERRVLFPVRTFEGYLVGMHGRAIDKGIQPVYRMYQYQKHTNAGVWYGEHLVNLDEPLVVVESVFDLVRVYSMHKNVIAALSASVNKKKIQRLQDAMFLYLMLDNDVAGRRAAQKIRDNLPGVYKRTIFIPDRYKDPGEMLPEQIRAALKQAGIAYQNRKQTKDS